MNKDDIFNSILTKVKTFLQLSVRKIHHLVTYINILQICLLVLVISAWFPIGFKVF